MTKLEKVGEYKRQSIGIPRGWRAPRGQLGPTGFVWIDFSYLSLQCLRVMQSSIQQLRYSINLFSQIIA